MAYIVCEDCLDFRKLSVAAVKCACKKSGGRLDDKGLISLVGNCRAVNLNQHELSEVLKGIRQQMTTVVIPESKVLRRKTGDSWR